jgi:hypothetical protein
MTTRRIDEIVVGELHRRDLGDIDLADLGLLQPIVIRPDDRLLVGTAASPPAKALGCTEIPVNVAISTPW